MISFLEVVVKLGVRLLAIQEGGLLWVIKKQSKTGNLNSLSWRQA